MTEDRWDAYRGLVFIESRIPVLDALKTFVPEGQQPNPAVQRVLHGRPSRWYPVDGGHRVLVLFEGGEYDHDAFSVEPKAWDHETCTECRAHVPPMTLCWVTKDGPFVLLCSECKASMNEGGA